MTTRRSVLTAIAAAGAAIPLAMSGPVCARIKISRPADQDDRAVSAGRSDRHHGAGGGRCAWHDSSARSLSKTAPAPAPLIGTKSVAAADPDGYTLLFGSSGSLAVAPALYSSLGMSIRSRCSRLSQRWRCCRTFSWSRISSAGQDRRANSSPMPSPIPASSIIGAGLGTPPHLLSTLFKTEAGIDIVYVPYTGSAQSINDLLGGRTQFTIDGLVGRSIH